MELNALKNHVNRAERSTSTAIANLQAEVRKYRRSSGPFCAAAGSVKDRRVEL